MVELLRDDEIEEILRHEHYPAGGVAIAAIVYRARIRRANQEADEHHDVICRDVPLPHSQEIRNSPAPRHKLPGIHVCPDPRTAERD